jgi:hypothetical protein
VIDNELPERLLIGKQRSEWPLYVFSGRAQALSWVGEHPTSRQVWEITLAQKVPLRYVPPSEPRFAEPGDDQS